MKLGKLYITDSHPREGFTCLCLPSRLHFAHLPLGQDAHVFCTPEHCLRPELTSVLLDGRVRTTHTCPELHVTHVYPRQCTQAYGICMLEAAV